MSREALEDKIKIVEFYIEKSKINKWLFILIAVAEDGKKYVCYGDHYNLTYLIPYENAWDTKPL